MDPRPSDTQALRSLHERIRVADLLDRKFSPEQFWDVVEGLLRVPHLEVEEIGRSALGRPLRSVRFGSGDTRVLIWSQMHGDEPTATFALADLLRFVSESPGDERVRLWGERLTLMIVPILNPDGAALFQRRNAQGIDLNRDARARFSPEVRALLSVQERFQPHLAFNLHDEDTKTRVGKSNEMTALSLLAPAFDEALSDNEERLQAKRMCVVVKRAVEPLLGAHLARYAEHFTPGSLGDTFQGRGTAAVLIESGWWPLDPELQFLRAVNFVGLVAAIDAAATGAHAHMDLAEYESIPRNDRKVFDLLVRGGRVVLPGAEPFRVDLGLNFDSSLDLSGGHIADVGELSDYSGRDILVAEGLFLHPHEESLARDAEGRGYLELKRPASFTIRAGEEPDSPAVWVIQKGVARRVEAPDP